MTEEKRSEMLNNTLSAEWQEDNFDRSWRTYDLELFLDNLQEVCISEEEGGYPGCHLTFAQMLEKIKMTEEDFLNKWIAILREKKIGEWDGIALVNEVIDRQNDDIGRWHGFTRAKNYTDDELKEFFRECWYA